MPPLSIGTYWDSSLLSESIVVLFCVIALSNRNQLMWTQPSQRFAFVGGAAIFGKSPSNWPSTLSLSLKPTKAVEMSHKIPQEWLIEPFISLPITLTDSRKLKLASACVRTLCGILSFCLMPSLLTLTVPV